MPAGIGYGDDLMGQLFRLQGLGYGDDMLNSVLAGAGVQGQVAPAGSLLGGGMNVPGMRGGSTGAIPGGGAGGPMFTGSGDQRLEQARQRAFGSLGQGAEIFRGDLGQTLQRGIQQILAGQNLPFSQGVQANMFSQAADAAGGAEQSARNQIREGFANAGMGGSGGMTRAFLDAAGRRSDSLAGARNQIQTTAALENFGAQERARQAGTGFLAQQSAAEAPFRLKEADLLSRFEVTGQSPFAFGGMGGGGTQRALGGQQGVPQGQGPRYGSFGPQLSMPAQRQVGGQTANGTSSNAQSQQRLAQYLASRGQAPGQPPPTAQQPGMAGFLQNSGQNPQLGGAAMGQRQPGGILGGFRGSLPGGQIGGQAPQPQQRPRGGILGGFGGVPNMGF